MNSPASQETNPIGISPFNRLYCNGQLKPRYLYLRKPTSKRKSQRVSTNIICHISDEEVHACLACLMSAQPDVPHATSIIANGMTAADFCTRLITSHWRPILLPDNVHTLQIPSKQYNQPGQESSPSLSKRGSKRSVSGEVEFADASSPQKVKTHCFGK